MQRGAGGGRGGTHGGLGGVGLGAASWRERVRLALPYLVGGVMFAVAVWVLYSALRRYELADLHAELATLTAEQVGLAVLYTFLSFVALIGYEWSALSLVGRRMPPGHLSLASFCTQSIAHSTGFAFVVGASLRYHFYAARGLGIADVAKVQMYFTATFTLGVATLAGAVVLVEPWRLATATGLPPWLWRVAAAATLALVIAYVVWGAFFHRPLRWRGRELVLPDAGATLTQIFFGVTDLMAVAAALYVLLPAELGLGYLEVLAIFMASIVIGLISHVPGSLGVFESAVILLVQPPEGHTLPLIGALLAFRAVYYLLPLACGVLLLALSELSRWRVVLPWLVARAQLDPGPVTPQLAALLVGAAGMALIVAALLQGGTAPAAEGMTRLARLVEAGGGLALLLLACGLWRRRREAWPGAVALLLGSAAAALVAGAPRALGLLLLLLALGLLACRGRLADPAASGSRLRVWAVVLGPGLASGLWLLGRI